MSQWTSTVWPGMVLPPTGPTSIAATAAAPQNIQNEQIPGAQSTTGIAVAADPTPIQNQAIPAGTVQSQDWNGQSGQTLQTSYVNPFTTQQDIWSFFGIHNEDYISQNL